MGTKNNPSTKFDCYGKAEPDEPMFILLGRDPLASIIVGIWAALRREMEPQNATTDQIHEAFACSDQMLRWAVQKGKAEKVKEAMRLFDKASKSFARTTPSPDSPLFTHDIKKILTSFEGGESVGVSFDIAQETIILRVPSDMSEETLNRLKTLVWSMLPEGISIMTEQGPS